MTQRNIKFNESVFWLWNIIILKLWKTKLEKRSSCPFYLVLRYFLEHIAFKEFSDQYCVLIYIYTILCNDTHILTGNEKLCKIYFKTLCFQNVLAFFHLFYSYHHIRYFIHSDCMWRHVCTICTGAATGGVA